MEACTQWRFTTRGDGEWRWSAADGAGTQTSSTGAFGSVEDCMADAAQHGYTNYFRTEAAYA